MSVIVKPTAADVIDEGQLRVEYFPNLTNDNAFNTYIRSRIEDVDSEVQLQVGSNYTSSTSAILRLLHKAEIYLTLGRLWQTIKQVMDAYDAEELPPEFVEPDQAAANRDFYLTEGNKIVSRFDTTSDNDSGFAMPYLGGVSATEESPTMLEVLLDNDVIIGEE